MSANVLDLSIYYGKLARQEVITPDEISDLLKMAAHFRNSAAYLASCHAATAQGLPASASRSVKGRMASICRAGEKLLAGDTSGMTNFPTDTTAASLRCRHAAEQLEGEIQASGAAKARTKALKQANKLPG